MDQKGVSILMYSANVAVIEDIHEWYKNRFEYLRSLNDDGFLNDARHVDQQGAVALTHLFPSMKFMLGPTCFYKGAAYAAQSRAAKTWEEILNEFTGKEILLLDLWFQGSYPQYFDIDIDQDICELKETPTFSEQWWNVRYAVVNKGENE
jgi:hypothetical protein